MEGRKVFSIGNLFHRKKINLQEEMNLESFWYGRHSWGDRFSQRSVNFWKERALFMVDILSNNVKRQRFIRDTDPNIQYQVLELVSKYTQNSSGKINKSFNHYKNKIIAKTFGEMFIFYNSSCIDETKINEFLKKRWRLCISDSSLKLFFFSLRQNLELSNNNLESIFFQEYLTPIFLSLNNEDQGSLINNLPKNLILNIMQTKVKINKKLTLFR